MSEEHRPANTPADLPIPLAPCQRITDAHWRFLWDAVPTPVYVKDADGRYLFVNKVTEFVHACEADSMIGKTDAELFAAGASLWQPPDDGSAESIDKSEREETFAQADGIHTYKTEQFALPHEADEPPLSGGIAMDITEEMIARKALVKAEKMAALGVLAAGVAHEFNNLNTASLGFLDMVMRDPELSKTHARCLKQVENSIKRSSRVTHSLLSFAAERENPVIPACLNQLVQETLVMLEKEFNSEGITIQYELESLPPVRLDTGSLAQVLLNLVINARHAMRGRPEKRLTIATGYDADTIFFTVRDTGCGISPADQERIYRPLYSTKVSHGGDSEVASTVRGAGLGLTVSQQLLNEMGGEISVQSTPEEGAIFTVRVPRIDEGKARKAAREEDESRPLADARILVLEDEETIRDILQIDLSAAGATVTTLSSGHNALSLVQEESFDVILADLQMPKMSGLEFIRQMDSPHLGRQPVIMVVTGNIHQHDSEGYAALGIRRVIGKPFISQRLIATIKEELIAATAREMLR